MIELSLKTVGIASIFGAAYTTFAIKARMLRTVKDPELIYHFLAGTAIVLTPVVLAKAAFEVIK